MHILYLHQYFATPRGSTGTRSYEFARRWVSAGHRVTLVTTLAQLTDADLPPGPRPRVTRTNIDGIDILALNLRYHQSMGFARRIWVFLQYMLRTTWIALRHPGVDMIYASSTPLTVGVPAMVARWLRGRRYVFEVRDPWPEIPIALGVIRGALSIAALRLLERTIYRWADAIVTLSPGMSDLVRNTAPPDKRIETIPNCADTDLFTPNIEDDSVRDRLGWGRKIVCIHTGAMGRVNGLGVIVRAAEHFRADPDLLFVLLGDGREKDGLKAERDRLHLTNLDILDAVSKQEMPAILAAADVGLMTITNVPALEHNSANKFFDYLSAGKPVLLNYGGWQRETLEKSGAGLGCSMEEEAAFIANIASLKADEKLRNRMGEAARQLAIATFDRDRLAEQALAVVAEAHLSRGP